MRLSCDIFGKKLCIAIILLHWELAKIFKTVTDKCNGNEMILTHSAI